jgi:pimeloyl-ACP methyl ester carboxylesterase
VGRQGACRTVGYEPLPDRDESDWIFRGGLGGAYPHHPSFTRAFLEEWKRPFQVQGTLDGFRAMSWYGIQGFQLSQLRTVRVPALVLWGSQDTVDSVPAGRKSAQALRAPFHLLAGPDISPCSPHPKRSHARSTHLRDAEAHSHSSSESTLAQATLVPFSRAKRCS